MISEKTTLRVATEKAISNLSAEQRDLLINWMRNELTKRHTHALLEVDDGSLIASIKAAFAELSSHDKNAIVNRYSMH